MNTSSNHTDTHKEDVYGESFSMYEKMLRTWLVAYGVGGPVLFMTQKDLRQALVTAPDGRTIGVLFLLGVLAQVLESFLYKTSMWYLYREAAKENECHSMYTFSKWVEDHYLIDIIFDLITIVSFAIATYMVFPIVYN